MTDISLTDITLPPSLSRDLPKTGSTATAPPAKGSRSIADKFKPGSFSEEKKTISKYFDLSIWQILIIIGIAISLLAAFINTYNAVADLNTACVQTEALQKKLNTQFIVMVVLGSIALVVGIILSWLFRRGTGSRLITLGLTASGIFAIIYGLTIRYANTSNNIKLGISWGALAAFVVLGILMGKST